MLENVENFSQQNSPDGEFLQSLEWRKFQESVGRKTYEVFSAGFFASIIEHNLPIVGKYFYLPRGPVFNDQESVNSEQETRDKEQEIVLNDKFPTCLAGRQVSKKIQELIMLAEKNRAGWIRVDVENEEILSFLEKNTNHKIVKAPHDMQPREIFVIDITKPEEQLLVEMKPKTRYNVRLAEKKGVSLRITNLYLPTGQAGEYTNKKYIEEFLRLTKIMAERQGIIPHADDYYRKMFEIIPSAILKLYIAKHNDEVIAANLMVFYGKTCTYLHGASDDKYKNLMAPYLLQWQAICDAKKNGCERYDMGGVNTAISNFQPASPAGRFPISNKIQNSNDQILKKIPNTKYQIPNTKWAGITKFKLGFSPNTAPTEFLGSYDIIINKTRYFFYRSIQLIKSFL